MISVKDIDPALLMMSRKNCHARNVSSIVVAKEPGGPLTRMFLAWPGHELDENHLGGKLTVGIHDHKYDLRLRWLSGFVVHATYEPSDEGTELNKWRFTSGLVNRKPQVESAGRERLTLKDFEVLAERGIFITHDEIHDVRAHGPAAWLVTEGPTIPGKQHTTLYTKTPTVEFDPELYVPFESADEVIQHVEDFNRC